MRTKLLLASSLLLSLVFHASALTCDTGSLDTTCHVTTNQDVTTENIEGSGSLFVASGGKLTTNSGPGTNATINMTENVSVKGTLDGNFNVTSANVTVYPSATVSADGKGYSGGSSQSDGSGTGGGGGANDGGGAGYGGSGGSGKDSGSGGGTYDGATNPTSLGSGGGGGYGGGGGNGGGLIRLNATDTVTINTTVSVDGTKPGCSQNDNCGGGGSGGSVYVDASVLRGNGTLSAEGGDPAGSSGDGGGGGGGRIAVYYTTNSSQLGYTVAGGNSPDGGDGQQGTIYLEDVSESSLTLGGTVDLSGNEVDAKNLTVRDSSASINLARSNFPNINDFELGSGSTIDLSHVSILSDVITFESNLDLTLTNATLDTSQNTTIDRQTTFKTGSGTETTANLTFYNLTFRGSLKGNFNITATNITIHPSATVSADGKGYSGGSSQSDGSGPGGGGGANDGGGAGYGGSGGSGKDSGSGGGTYGDATNPARLGSGGGGGYGGSGGNGGGILYFNATSTAIINTTVTADGTKPGCSQNDNCGGGGSGGSVYVDASVLRGNGTLSAEGGDPAGSSGDGGGGGGGRIAVYYTTNSSQLGYTVAGGNSPDGGDGQQGSKYWDGVTLTASLNETSVQEGEPVNVSGDSSRQTKTIDSSGTTTTDTAKNVTIYLNGNVKEVIDQDSTAFYDYSLDTSGLSTGTHTVKVEQNESGVTVTKDFDVKRKPAITDGPHFTNYSAGHKFNTSATVFDPEGESDISTCTVFADDNDGNMNSYGGSLDTSFGNSSEAACNYTQINSSITGFKVDEAIDITIQAADGGGLKKNSTTAQNTIPNAAPSASNLNVSGAVSDSSVTNHTPDFSWSYSDPEGDSQSGYQVQVWTQSGRSGTSKWDPGFQSTAGTSDTYDGSTLDDGKTYYLNVRVADGTDNSTWTESSFTMKSDAPVIDNETYQDPVDVENESEFVQADVVNNDVHSIDTVYLETNTSGSLSNSSMSSISGDGFNGTIDFSSAGTGLYAVNVWANDTVSQWNVTRNTISVENVTLTEELNQSSYSSGETVKVNGTVTLQPDGTSVTSTDVKVYVDGDLNQTVTTDSNGVYSATFTPPSKGDYNLTVNVTDSDGIVGTNTTTLTVDNPPDVSNRALQTDSGGTAGGWGEHFNFSADVSDSDGDDVDVTLWLKLSGTWEKNSTKSCSSCSSSTKKWWNLSRVSSSHVGDAKYLFEKDDGILTENTSTKSFTVQGNNVSLTVHRNDSSVNRSGSDTTSIGIRVKDTDRDRYVGSGVSGTFWLSKDGSGVDTKASCSTNSSGFCLPDVDPGSGYSTGIQNWTGGVSDSGYSDTNTSYGSFTVVGDLFYSIDSPGEDSSFNVSDDVTLRYNVTDDTGSLVTATTSLEVNNSGFQTGCSVQSEGNGYYNCTWDTFEESSGSYGIRINGSKTDFNDNDTVFTSWFDLKNPTVSMDNTEEPESQSVDNVTNDRSVNVSVTFNVTNTGSNDAFFVNQSIYDLPTDPDWKAYPSSTDCGNLTAHEVCSKDFTIEIANGTGQGTYFVKARSMWENPNGTIEKTTNDSEVTVSSNPVLNASKDKITASVGHDSTKTVGSFTIENTGNDIAQNIEVTHQNGSMPSSWTSFSPSSVSSLNSGSTKTVDVDVSVPGGKAAGQYDANVTVNRSTTTTEDWVNVSVTVPENKSWVREPGSKTVDVAPDGSGDVDHINITSIGNVDLSFGLSENGNGTSLLTLDDTSLDVTANEFNSTKITYSIPSDQESGLYQVNYTINDPNADPNKQYTIIDLNVSNLAPDIENGSVSKNFADIDRETVYLTVDATDNIDVNYTWANITKPDGSFEVKFLSLESGNTYNGSLTPSQSGNYTIEYSANDSEDAVNTTTETFEVDSVAETSDKINSSVTTKTFTGITQDSGNSFSTDIMIENTGQGGSYNTNVTWSSSSGISLGTTENSYQTVSPGGVEKDSYTVDIASATLPGIYWANATVEWIDPDDSSRTNTTSIEINVSENPVVTIEESGVDKTIEHGKKAETEITVNATGNDHLNYTNGSCGSNDFCDNVNLEFNRSNFGVDAGNWTPLEVNVSVPRGKTPDFYVGDLTVDAQGASGTVEYNITVPENRSWTLSSEEINKSLGKDHDGDLSDIAIENNGNVFTNFTVTEYGNISSILDVNQTSFNVSRNSDYDIGLSYNTSDPGWYRGNLSLENSSASPAARNISVTFDVINLTVSSVSPTSGDVEMDVKDGETVEIHSNATRDGSVQDGFMNWTVDIGNSTCSVQSEEYISSGAYWNITCEAPDLDDASNYTLDVEGEWTNESAVTSYSETGAINYKDVTSPTIEGFNEPQEPVDGDNLTVEINISDNQGIDSKNATVTYPNGTTVDKSYTSIGGDQYQFNITETGQVGDYEIVFGASDSEGLSTLVTEYGEIYRNVTLNITSTNAKGNAVDANYTFKRPSTGEALHNVSINTSSGFLNATVHEDRLYDVEVEVFDHSIELNNVNVSTDSAVSMPWDDVPTSDVSVSDSDNLLKVLGGEVNLTFDNTTIELNYSGTSPDTESDIRVWKCEDYDLSGRTCDGSWSKQTDYSLDKISNTISINASGFSAYAAGEESTSSSSSSSSSGGGGGGGGSSDDTDLGGLSEGISDIKDILNGSEDQSAEFGSSSIDAKLKPGETKTVSLSVTNNLNESQTFSFSTGPVVSPFVNVPGDVTVQPDETWDVVINISIPPSERPDSFSGNLNIVSDRVDNDIPVNIQVLPANEELLDLSLDPVFSTVQPGGNLKVETTFSNQGYARNVDVTVRLELVDPETNETVTKTEKTLAVGTSLTRVISLEVPEGIEKKRYEVRGTARYSNLEIPRVATAITPVEVATPFWERKVLGLTYRTAGIAALVMLFTSLLGYGVYQWRRKKIMEKKRYLEQIDLDTIPGGGDRQAYVGQLAEIGTRTFVELDDLTTHTLIAGATGSGKTVTGQVMVEEALEEGVNVIVLDPTAQWTGFLRECTDSDMKQLYGDFGLDDGDATAFDGNIRAVEPDQEKIDITPYLENEEEGQIIVFSLHKLDSKNIDEFVDNTIQQVFDANLPERNELDTIIVYDEVHRLLQKFGGSGQGLKQLERGAREFRKWGVGMVLLSQVISDFSGEIRANIGTTVQMRTQYEADLERLKDKYGMDTVRSVAKAEIGSGMLQNSDYNHGRPYFVDFRPLLHSPHRLDDQELERYEEYNRRIDELEDKVDSMEESGEDVYEYRNELKLAKRNLKKGSFSLVETYLDELEEELS